MNGRRARFSHYLMKFRFHCICTIRDGISTGNRTIRNQNITTTMCNVFKLRLVAVLLQAFNVIKNTYTINNYIFIVCVFVLLRTTLFGKATYVT